MRAERISLRKSDGRVSGSVSICTFTVYEDIRSPPSSCSFPVFNRNTPRFDRRRAQSRSYRHGAPATRRALSAAILGKPRPGLYHSAAMKVLFITATRIGDAVMSTSVLGHLVEPRPDARFTND